MPHDFREQNKCLADPPVEEGHRQPKSKSQGKIRQQRYDNHLNELLLAVRETREHRNGMLREMMRSVEFPQRANLVAGAVVSVEPEVKDDGVKQEFDGEPQADVGEVPGVEVSGHENEQQRSEDGEKRDGEESLEEVVVRDWVAGVVVAVEEADSVDLGISHCSITLVICKTLTLRRD